MALALALPARPLRGQTDTEVRRGAETAQGARGRSGGSPCAVTAVLDGDTFTCLDGRTVRLLGLDAPELEAAPWGARARAILASLLPREQTVWLALTASHRDGAGRTLAYVFTRDDVFVNREMVARGFALALPRRRTEADGPNFLAAEAAARTGARGIWADPPFQPCPWVAGTRQRDLPPCPAP